MEQYSLKEYILQLEERLMNYEYKELDELLAEEFLEFGSSGTVYNKKVQLEVAISNTTASPIKFTVTDFNIKLLASGVVLATYRTFRHNDSKYALRSSIWRIKEGKWQMEFHQGTPIESM